MTTLPQTPQGAPVTHEQSYATMTAMWVEAAENMDEVSLKKIQLVMDYLSSNAPRLPTEGTRLYMQEAMGCTKLVS